MSERTASPTAASEPAPSRLQAAGNRWLGIGLAAVVSVVTLGLGLTGQLTLYISPETVWFACAGAVVTLLGAVWSFLLPLGEELDHGHDHGHAPASSSEEDGHEHDHTSPRRTLAAVGTVSAGVVATGVVVAGLVLPPASLSVELAMSRSDGDTTLFAGADAVTLGVADTSTFGVGEWASVFSTATRPEAYDGADVTLTGFVTPAGEDPDEVRLTRLVITHCVIDAQPAAVPVGLEAWAGDYEVGQWVEITGVVRADADGELRIDPSSVEAVEEPGDPYEY